MGSPGDEPSIATAAQSCDIGTGIFATRPFAAGDDVIDFQDATVVAERSYQTLEVGRGLHVYSARIALVNHSCDPNLRVDTARLTLVATKPIAPGDMLTLFYPEAEWEMAEPFNCRCGAASCLGWIAGARHLNAEQRLRYRFSPHIEALFDERNRSAT